MFPTKVFQSDNPYASMWSDQAEMEAYADAHDVGSTYSGGITFDDTVASNPAVYTGPDTYQEADMASHYENTMVKKPGFMNRLRRMSPFAKHRRKGHWETMTLAD